MKDQLFGKEIYIRLADGNMGFLYRVRRFGLFGKSRFVAAFSREGGQESTPAILRPDSKKNQKGQ